jgi:phosphoadenosine phosphosulfate reductase
MESQIRSGFKEEKMRVEELKQALAGAGPEQLIRYFLENFRGKIALSSSMAAEDQVLTDMICKIDPAVKIFTLDTGRLPQETYDVIESTRRKYGIQIEMLFPDRVQVEQMVNEHGPNLFRDSVENRKLCCQVRKIEPLKRALNGLDVWICGLRKEQSVTRVELEPIEWDQQFGLIKVSPLLDFSSEQVWEYIREHDVPYNALHDQGYPSIGCGCCTRAIKDGEDIRAGRWWWELPEHKECGLHWNKQVDKGSDKK